MLTEVVDSKLGHRIDEATEPICHVIDAQNRVGDLYNAVQPEQNVLRVEHFWVDGLKDNLIARDKVPARDHDMTQLSLVNIVDDNLNQRFTFLALFVLGDLDRAKLFYSHVLRLWAGLVNPVNVHFF